MIDVHHIEPFTHHQKKYKIITPTMFVVWPGTISLASCPSLIDEGLFEATGG